MKQLKPVYSKHVEDLIVQLEDLMEGRADVLWENFEGKDDRWEHYLSLDELTQSCREEILRIKATQLPMFYESV